MRKLVGLSLAASGCAIVMGGVGFGSANAADMAVPGGQFQGQVQGQVEGPAPGYSGPPPVQEGYAYPPPAAYGYPAPPPPVAYYAYAAPPVVVLPEGYYYGRGPYLRRYGPHFAGGYGHWDRGYRRW